MRITSSLIAFLFFLMPYALFAMSEPIMVMNRSIPVFRYSLGGHCSQKEPIRQMTFSYESSDGSIGLRSFTLLRNGKKISARKNIDPKSRTVTFHLSRSVNLHLCSDEVIDVSALPSLREKKGSTHRLSIELASDVSTDSQSVGIPMEGPWIEIR